MTTVLTVRPRINELNFHLFGQAVHPELFEVCATRTIRRNEYSLELNITPDGHAIRFRHQELILTEVSAGVHHPLPTLEELLKHSIEGVRRSQLRYGDRIDYQSKVEIEIVNPKLFVAVQQQLDQKVETHGLIHRFGSNGRLKFGALSYIHTQSFLQHVLVRAFHTFPDSNAVVTSETRFSVSQ